MIKLRIVTSVLSLFFVLGVHAQDQLYELRTYELKFSGPAKVLHDYFETALIPALNRQGINHVGAFEEAGDALPKKLYLLIAYDDLNSYLSSKDALLADEQYVEAAKPYLTAPPQGIAYKRIRTNLIRASSGFPRLVAPAEDAGLFELRIYESHNEDALRRKVKMFNESEFEIFDEVGLPMVFFGANIAGDQMPCLTYLLAFKDKDAHAGAWARFGPHPEWQRIVKLEEYANTIIDITRVFLKPLPYSQL